MCFLTSGEAATEAVEHFAHFDRLRTEPAFAPDVEPYLQKIDRAAS